MYKNNNDKNTILKRITNNISELNNSIREIANSIMDSKGE
jgi:DNA-binding MurR/RpiR family transcriptional regulator